MSERKRNDPLKNRHDASMLNGKSNSSRKKSLNSTLLLNQTCTFKEALCENRLPLGGGGVKSQIKDIELTLAYNGYLQALLKQEIIENQIDRKKKQFDGQIVTQKDYALKRKYILDQIQKDTDLLKKKEEIIKIINNIEENIKNFSCLHEKYRTQENLKIIHNALRDKSGTLVLKNTKPLESEECDKLIESIKKLAFASKMVVKCGRDFNGIHDVAEECRNLVKIIKSIKETQVILSAMEKHAGFAILQKLSDEFAKQYVI